MSNKVDHVICVQVTSPTPRVDGMLTHNMVDMKNSFKVSALHTHCGQLSSPPLGVNGAAWSSDRVKSCWHGVN